jgi:hypothetical protein
VDSERWASIPEAHNYLISDDGHVRRMLANGTWRDLRPSRNSKGYRKVCIGRGRQEYVHRLVWMAFRGVIPDDMRVDHRDDNQLNNSLPNLQLLTDDDNNAKRWGKWEEPEEDVA